jgi:hypothetical protein
LCSAHRAWAPALALASNHTYYEQFGLLTQLGPLGAD